MTVFNYLCCKEGKTMRPLLCLIFVSSVFTSYSSISALCLSSSQSLPSSVATVPKINF
jgi:hypothetical protein